MNRAMRFIPQNTRPEGRCSRAFGLGDPGDSFEWITVVLQIRTQETGKRQVKFFLAQL
jgi:hypothetical protein